MAGYAFARIEFPFKNFIFVLLLSVLMVPGQIFLLPQYQLIQKMGLLNTIPALFLPNLFSAFGTFLLRQFFMSMPQELEDAAIVDGCNRFQIFGRIMVPLIQPGIAALTIFTFKFAWNDFMWPLIVNNSMDKLILGPALSTLQGQYTTQYPMQMAGAVLDVIPLVVIFFIFQKQFIDVFAQVIDERGAFFEHIKFPERGQRGAFGALRQLLLQFIGSRGRFGFAVQIRHGGEKVFQAGISNVRGENLFFIFVNQFGVAQTGGYDETQVFVAFAVGALAQGFRCGGNAGLVFQLMADKGRQAH